MSGLESGLVFRCHKFIHKVNLDMCNLYISFYSFQIYFLIDVIRMQVVIRFAIFSFVILQFVNNNWNLKNKYCKIRKINILYTALTDCWQLGTYHGAIEGGVLRYERKIFLIVMVNSCFGIFWIEKHILNFLSVYCKVIIVPKHNIVSCILS